jgi:hypothetical protein
MGWRLKINIILPVITVIVFIILSIWTKSFFESRKNYRIAEEHLQAGDNTKAITFFDRSLHWYTPLNPYIQKSAESLWEIGLQAKQEGDIRLALVAVRTIRQGFYAARSFYTPGGGWIARCDTKIATLIDRELESFEPPEVQTRRPSVDAEPDIFWTVILEIGLLGWVGSVIGFFVCTKRGENYQLSLRPAILWSTTIILFYGLWILGMTQA